MKRALAALLMALVFNVEVKAQDTELISEYFKRVPLEEAHVITGQSHNIDFDPASIKVLVWNIKKTQEDSWQKEFLQFGKGRELFLLQEAYPNELFNFTTASFTDVRWDMGISFRYRLYNDLPTGTMIGSKVTPAELVVKHSPDLEPMTETPKAMTFGKYPLAGYRKELLVISVHGINFTDYASFKRHMVQAEVEIEKHRGPVLMAGDFNTRTKERMYYLFKLMGKLRMKEVAFKNGHQRMVAKFTNNILDHGFVRGLKVKDAEVIGWALGSDHKPMTLELSLED